MARLRRRIFFWTLVVLFATITPAIIMDARGYRFDFHRGVFVHSGSIMLKTNPQNFNLYANGTLETSKQLNRINNSYNITGLFPRSYDLSVGADGYQTWTKKTEVHSNLTSEFWNVLLVRNHYDRTAYETQGLDNFFVSPQNNKLAFAQNSPQGVTIKVSNIKDKVVENSFFFPSAVFSPGERKENIEWSPNEDYLSIPIKMNAAQPPENKNTPLAHTAGNSQNSGYFTYFIADLANNNFFNLNSFTSKEDIKDARWDPGNKNYLFFLSKNESYRANINDKNDIALVANNVSAFDLSKTGVYFTQSPNELVYKSDLNGTGNTNQLTSDFPDSNISQTEKLIAYDDGRIAFLSNDNKLFIYNKGDHDTYFRKLADSIRGMQFSDDGKKLLYWSDNELFVYFLRDWNVQPARSENDIQTITRYSENIKNTQWFKDYEHVIFSAGPYVKIIELDSRDHRNCMDILKTGTDTPLLVYNHSLEYLFFIDGSGDSSDLYSIVFPEPGGFLGVFPPPAQQ